MLMAVPVGPINDNGEMFSVALAAIQCAFSNQLYTLKNYYNSTLWWYTFDKNLMTWNL